MFPLPDENSWCRPLLPSVLNSPMAKETLFPVSIFQGIGNSVMKIRWSSDWKILHMCWKDNIFILKPATASKMAWMVSGVSNKALAKIKISHLTHWGRVTHISVRKLTVIGSDNGLSPGRRQAIIWTNTGILLIGPLGTNFNEIIIKIHTFSFKKIHLKMSSGKWRPFCLGLNVLIHCNFITNSFRKFLLL